MTSSHTGPEGVSTFQSFVHREARPGYLTIDHDHEAVRLQLVAVGDPNHCHWSVINAREVVIVGGGKTTQFLLLNELMTGWLSRGLRRVNEL